MVDGGSMTEGAGVVGGAEGGGPWMGGRRDRNLASATGASPKRLSHITHRRALKKVSNGVSCFPKLVGCLLEVVILLLKDNNYFY